MGAALLLLLPPLLAGSVLAIPRSLLGKRGSPPSRAAPAGSAEEYGQPLLSTGPMGSRIVGGQEARMGAWPWAVSLQHSRAHSQFTHVCGGVLLNRSSVLTAGHCVVGRTDVYSWRVVLGTQNLWKHGKHAVKRKIRSIAVHPKFKRKNFENDLALLQLNSAVHYSHYVQPIHLPPANLLLTIENQTECFIIGWGRTKEKGKMSPVLKEARVEIIPSSICNSSASYGGMVDENMICAGSPLGGTDSCQGDSGGPLMCFHPCTNKYYLFGIASFGIGCGHPRFPGIYVRLSQYQQWVESKLLLQNKAVKPICMALAILPAAIGTVLAQTF